MLTTQFAVLLDSCVLYNAPVRDLLLQLSSQGLFRAKWTTKILEEFISNLLEKRPDLKRVQLERTCDIMNKSVMNCLVEDYEELSNGIVLPDPNDDHVVAAALKSQAQIIVTWNLRDFPESTLVKYQIEALDPDTFLRSQLDLYKPIFLSSVKTVVQD
jgi:predicted nucleic acid-binding protein